MATREKYEQGARVLAQRTRETRNQGKKANLLTYLGNLRNTQYRVTEDPRAQRLASNCYKAATRLNLKVVNKGIEDKLNK